MSRLKRDLVEDRMSAPVYDHHRFDASQPPWRTISILRLVLVGLSMHYWMTVNGIGPGLAPHVL